MSLSNVRSREICFFIVRGVFNLSKGGSTMLSKPGANLLGVHLNLHLGMYLSSFMVRALSGDLSDSS